MTRLIILAALVGAMVSGPVWGQDATEYVYARCVSDANKRLIPSMELRVKFCRCVTPIMIEHIKPEALEMIRLKKHWLVPLGQGLAWPYKDPEAFTHQILQDCPDVYRLVPGLKEDRG